MPMRNKYRRLLHQETQAQQHLRGVKLPRAKPLSAEHLNTLQDMVRRLAEEAGPSPVGYDRRQTERRPFPHAMLAIPCDDNKLPRLQESSQVVCKDFSGRDIGFLHTRAVRDKYMILSFTPPDQPPISILTEIVRVRPLRLGLYLIGGRFLERVDMGGRDEPSHPAGGSPAGL